MKRSSQAQSRFVVGIDLGTTNSVVAFADMGGDEPGPLQVLRIPQLTAPGAVEARPLLPSFLYLPAAGELPAARVAAPLEQGGGCRHRRVRPQARRRGAGAPGRLGEIVAVVRRRRSHRADPPVGQPRRREARCRRSRCRRATSVTCATRGTTTFPEAPLGGARRSAHRAGLVRRRRPRPDGARRPRCPSVPR